MFPNYSLKNFPYDLPFSHNTSVTDDDDDRQRDKWQSCRRRLNHSCSTSKTNITIANFCPRYLQRWKLFVSNCAFKGLSTRVSWKDPVFL